MNTGSVVGKVLTIVVTAAGTALVGYFVFRPAPYANFRGDKYSGPAPLTIYCTNESLYAKRVAWDFNDGSRTNNSDGTLEHTFSNPGVYEVTLTALGEAHAKRAREVDVMEALMPSTDRLLDHPFKVTLIGLSPGGIERRVKTFAINQTQTDHQSLFSSTTKFYDEVFRPDSGFLFVDSRFVQRSANKALDVRSEIIDGGKAIRLVYSLTSGPQTDRYRGWLSGAIEATQERTTGDEEFEIARDFEIVAEGSFPLGSTTSVDSIDEIVVRDENGQQIGAGAPTSVIGIQGTDVIFRLSESSMGLTIDIARFPFD